MKTVAGKGVWAAPVVALAIGVWAEFADLTQLMLLAVAVPAMAVTLYSVAVRFRLSSRPVMLVLAATAIGLGTFAIAEGLYLAIHYARGGTLDFESLDSQTAMALALFGVHVGVGTVAGLALGVLSLGVVFFGTLTRRQRPPAPSTATELRRSGVRWW